MMNQDSPSCRCSRFPGLAFIAGMLVLGLLVGQSIRVAKRSDKYVTVKGLSEREMPADLAIWPISFTVTDNTLPELQKKIQTSRQLVQQFLLDSGFKTTEISQAPPHLTDFALSGEGEGVSRHPFRYAARLTILLRSPHVAEVIRAMESSDKLVQLGIVLSGSDYGSNADFLFTGVNQIKPDMIAEATLNARKAAEKFAEDSHSKVGSIRRATQGAFEVLDVNSSTPDRKLLRVVTTVEYLLE